MNRISLQKILLVNMPQLVSSLSSVVDADNPDTLPLQKVTKPTSKLSMLQQILSISNQSEDLSLHEIDVEKEINEFSSHAPVWRRTSLDDEEC